MAKNLRSLFRSGQGRDLRNAQLAYIRSESVYAYSPTQSDPTPALVPDLIPDLIPELGEANPNPNPG